MSFSKWWLSLCTSLNVEDDERKLVKICSFDISDSTDVNVTTTTQLETTFFPFFCKAIIFEISPIHNVLD